MTTLRAGSATHVGQVRSNNQDAELVVASQDLYGVADGMGGHQGGEVASAMAVALTEEHATEPTLAALKEAAQRANRAIFEKAGGDRDLHGMGTTLVAVQLVSGPDGEEIAWINVGDSRVYLHRDDRLLQLSADHSLVEDLVRDGQLTPDEAAVHPKRNILTRALGIDLDVKVDGNTVIPFTGDRFLLCSDGLFNEVSAEQMSSVLRRLADPTEAADELVRLANEGGGRDNITVVVVDVVDDEGRAETASANLAADATTVTAVVPPEPNPVVDPAPAMAGQRSSLPQPDDGYGADVDDPFAGIDKVRNRRFTWRVLAFFVLLLAVAGVVVGAIGWSASRTYHVAFQGDRVAVFRGKPGGVLWFDPKLEETTRFTRADVRPAMRADLEEGKEFGSRADVDRYLANLNEIVTDDATTSATTTTTTAPTSTTRTTAPKNATTAPVTSAPVATPTTAAPPATTAPPTTAPAP